jgi:hypothetical protein
LLLAIVLVAIVLATMAPELRRAARQRRAVDAIQQLGGKVLYDWQLNGTSGPVTIRDFIREGVGDPNVFAEVQHVDLSGTRATDEDLALVEEFRSMQWLVVSNTVVTERRLGQLARKLPNCRFRR